MEFYSCHCKQPMWLTNSTVSSGTTNTFSILFPFFFLFFSWLNSNLFGWTASDLKVFFYQTRPALVSSYNPRRLSFQARIKKIMQTDEEIGKVAAAVPVIICILCKHVETLQGSVGVLHVCKPFKPLPVFTGRVIFTSGVLVSSDFSSGSVSEASGVHADMLSCS